MVLRFKRFISFISFRFRIPSIHHLLYIYLEKNFIKTYIDKFILLLFLIKSSLNTMEKRNNNFAKCNNQKQP